MRPFAWAAVLAVIATEAQAQTVTPASPVVVDKTSSGQAIDPPQGPVQVTSSILEIAAGASTPVHRHPYPRYVYVLAGRLQMDNLDTGETRIFEAGQFTVDPIGQWHMGRALGSEPVRLLTIDQTPPGKSNTVRRDQTP